MDINQSSTTFPNSSSVINFPKLCGANSVFWDPFLTIYTIHPTLSRCFRDTVLVWIPCSVFWISFPFYVLYLKSLPSVNTWKDKTIQNIATLTLLFALVTVSVICVFHDVLSSPLVISSVAASITYVVTFFAAGFLTHYEFSKNAQGNALQFTFWLLTFFFSSLNVTSIIIEIKTLKMDLSSMYVATSSVTFGLTTVLFLLTFRRDRVRRGTREEETTELLGEDNTSKVCKYGRCPEDEASVMSSISYMWIFGLLRRGYKQPLEPTDLYALSYRDSSEALYPVFENKWGRRSQNTSWPGVQLFLAMLPVFWVDLLHAVLHRLSWMVWGFMKVIVLSALIQSIEQQKDYKWEGVLLSVLLTLTLIACGVSFKFSKFSRVRAGMRMNVVLMGGIFRKCLRLSSRSLSRTSVGEVINLVSVDMKKIKDMMDGLTEVVSLVFEVPLTLLLLYLYLDRAVLVPVLLMLSVILCNMAVLKKYAGLQKTQMRVKDARLRSVDEILRSIKILKLYAWEKIFRDKTTALRCEELRAIWKQSLIKTFTIVLGDMSKFYCTMAMTITYALLGNVVTASSVFVSYLLLINLRRSTKQVPLSVTQMVEGMISMRRVCSFLEEGEFDSSSVTRKALLADGNSIQIQEGSFTYNRTNNDLVLSGINIKIKYGELIAVVGKVGSGKSSFLSSILGEVTKITGQTIVSGNIAHVPQEAWIQNATVKDNILFGKMYIETFYNDIIDACALRHDLTVLPAGDRTEIGEKGINLSGGQKQRVALARAVYHNNDVYLLDDPLAAVDAHVSAHLFNKVIGPSGMLVGKTRILVTHSLTHLPECDRIIVMHEGRIVESGTYDQLIELDGKLAEMVKSQDCPPSEGHASEGPVAPESTESEKDPDKDKTILERKIQPEKKSKKKPKLGKRAKEYLESKKRGMTKLIDDEETEKGQVRGQVFSKYCDAFGAVNMAGLCLGLVLQNVAFIAWSVWLSKWTDDSKLQNPQEYINLRITVLVILTMLILLGRFLTMWCLFAGCIRASRILHSRLMDAILRSPLSFFDTTPKGRVLNRFCKDIDELDLSFSLEINVVLSKGTFILSSMLMAAYTSPLFLTVVPAIVLLLYFISKYAIRALRQLLRINSILVSPINSHMDESLAGATSIRAFNAQNRFIDRMESLVDHSQAAFYLSSVASRWLSVVLQCVASLSVLTAALLAVNNDVTKVTAGLASMSVTFMVDASTLVKSVIDSICNTEVKFVAAERILNYCALSLEAPWALPDSDPPESWPNSGDVEFSNYSTRYRPGLDLVLKDVSFKIKSGEKIGVVGRTGAGKSSVALSLFRIIEAASGQIIIDGRDVADMGLHCLRSKLTIIPQEPVLFNGTLGHNLDPSETKNDHESWEALEKAHLKSFVSELVGQLEFEFEGDDSVSVGQRQLVCLARALLRKSKILVLDEATASIDVQTDDIIQTTIRTAFKDCTVITIAHRINTILDYDRILVMSGGRVVEFDSPDRLLKDPSSTFYKLASQAGVINGNGGANGKKKQ